MSFFGLFGKSAVMQRLDDALRATGVKPRGVADAVKIAAIKQLKDARGGVEPDAALCAAAAELLGYCILGLAEFAKTNDAASIERIEARLAGAIDSGQGLDARLVLLTLHAGITHPSVVERFELSVE